MSYQVQSISLGQSPIIDFDDSFTMDEVYDETLSELDNSPSSTTQYYNHIQNQISKAFLEAQEITENQFESVAQLVGQIEIIEALCNFQIKDVLVKVSIENEFIFYKKGEKGISFLSVDSDGDVLYNFTGYKKGFQTETYKFFDGIDYERIIYNLLARG